MLDVMVTAMGVAAWRIRNFASQDLFEFTVVYCVFYCVFPQAVMVKYGVVESEESTCRRMP